MSEQSGAAAIEYAAGWEPRWDAFVASCGHATVLHTRRFLGYHGDRFDDRSVLLVDGPSGAILAAMPAAEHPTIEGLIVSHPGATFGGLLMPRPEPAGYAAAFADVCRHYRDLGFKTLRLKTTPMFVGDQANEVATHHGLRHGKLVRADLWNAIQLATPYKFAPTRRSDIKAALKKGLTCRLAETEADWSGFHAMLAANLKDRHDAVPVHSARELADLSARLAAASRLMLCHGGDGQMLAGVWLIDYGHKVVHTQYIASTPEGRSLHAVDVVLAEAITQSAAADTRVFSFGINTLGDGWSINSDLMKYKLRFGAGSVLHTTFDYALDEIR